MSSVRASSVKFELTKKNDVITVDSGVRVIGGSTYGSRGSSTNLVRREDGSVAVERRMSSSDVKIAVTRRNSQTSQPNLLAVLGVEEKFKAVDPVLSAQDALDKSNEGVFVEHLWTLDAVGENYHTHIDIKDTRNSGGLTEAYAKKLLDEHGANVLTPPPKVPLWLLFLLQFTNILMIMLMAIGLVAFIFFCIPAAKGDLSQWRNLLISLLLWFTVFITCYETFSQEAKSDELMEKFRAMIPAQATVTRDGQQKKISATDIVPGDVLRLASGDKIPADCRVIFSSSMKVDQSMITGESEPVDVSVDSKNQIALESKNIIFNGSLAVDGMCIAVAIRTGDHTLIGKMVSLTGDQGKTSSTLQRDIIFAVRIIAIFALLQALLVMIVSGVVYGVSINNIFIQGFVTIMIGNVPQGLPTTITACLLIIAERMGEENVFVKKLDIVECLGSCTCICTDKTGTLTQNLMSVANLWVVNLTQDNKDFFSKVEAEKDKLTVQAKTLLEIATLNSRVTLEMKPLKSDPTKEELQPNGDATEIGMYRFFGTCISSLFNGQTVEQYRELNPKVHEIPFNSKNKWQMSIHAMAGQAGKQIMYVKGAPDVLLNKCSRFLAADGSIQKIDADFSKSYEVVYGDFGGNGERVLGFAMREMTKRIDEEKSVDGDFLEKLKAKLVGGADVGANAINDLIFVGLVTLRDPPRDEVPRAVQQCHEAGVKVVMVTGDHPVTAEAIARNIGLVSLPTVRSLARERGVEMHEVDPLDPAIGAMVVRGIEISGGTEVVGGKQVTIAPMTEAEWVRLVNMKEIVFARTSPENKLTIVSEFRKAGNITAMTGDGVNDSPALKQADIGIAMGLMGSDVAKEAGDIVLLDDNFASIVVGIREGRLLFANLKKSVAYTLAHLVPQIMPVLLWSFVGIPQSMGTLYSIFIDLWTELAPSSSLAFEPAEGTIMKVPPRDIKKDKLLTPALMLYSYFQTGMIITAGCYFTYFLIFLGYNVTAKDLFYMSGKYFNVPQDVGNGGPGGYFCNGVGPSWNDNKAEKGCYTEDDQNYIMEVVWTAWYLQIVIGQAIHFFPARTITTSIFTHGLFVNRYANYAIVIAIALGIFVAYCPGFQTANQGLNTIPIIHLYAALWTFGAIWGWTELRKLYSRTYPNSWFNKSFVEY